METIAKQRMVRISPQKARLVAETIRGKAAIRAVESLMFMRKKAAEIFKKLVQSALANAEHNHGVDSEQLRISKVYVDVGPSLKRTMPRAKGRADRITKRTSHITVALSDQYVGE